MLLLLPCALTHVLAEHALLCSDHMLSMLCPWDSWPRALLQSLFGCILPSTTTVINTSVLAIVTYLPCGFLALWSLSERCYPDYRPPIFTDCPGSHRDNGTTKYSTLDPVDRSPPPLLCETTPPPWRSRDSRVLCELSYLETPRRTVRHVHALPTWSCTTYAYRDHHSTYLMYAWPTCNPCEHVARQPRARAHITWPTCHMCARPRLLCLHASNLSPLYYTPP